MISVTVQAVTNSSTLSSLCTWGKVQVRRRTKEQQRWQHAAVRQNKQDSLMQNHAVVVTHTAGARSLSSAKVKNQCKYDVKSERAHLKWCRKTDTKTGKWINWLEKMAAKNTHRKERISTLKFLLFATLKLSRDNAATLQQDRLTLLTVRPLPSINRANSILTGILVDCNSSGWLISNKL